MNDFSDFNTRDLVKAYSSGETSPSEYMDWLINRVERVEPKVCALYAFKPQQAKQQAAESSKRWLKGETIGPLDGIPVTVKELIATKGDATPLGTAASDKTLVGR